MEKELTGDTIERIISASRKMLNETIAVRRHIHMHPELSFREVNTSEYIASRLKAVGIPFVSGIAGTGIIATIKGKGGRGPAVALRAELDALPINELNRVNYRSQNNGVMHACGHDAHMAMLLGAATILNSMTDCFRGELLFIFQPGEELVPGGATLLLKEGTLRKINPAAIIAQHVLPELTSGKTGFRAGKYMASSDEIYIDIHGRGGHAALPGQTTDQVLIASELVVELKKEVTAYGDNVPLVLGLGKFIAEGATNVIPEKVHIEGTLRTFDEEMRAGFHNIIIDKCEKFSEKYGVKIHPEIRKGFPVLVNDEKLTERAVSVARKVLGEKRVELLPVRMSSEDFAFYSKEFPVVFYRLGVKSATTPSGNLHTPDFDIDEAAMESGMATICAIAIDLVNTLQ
ncbi:MAG: M20 family metallopeptidase [Bacteroidales bacterium]